MQGDIAHGEYLRAMRLLLSREPPLPQWLLRVSAAQFELASPADGGMLQAQFVAWRTATARCTPAQLCAATRTEGHGGAAPTLEQLFHAADAGRKGRVTADDWARATQRFWQCSEPWCELNAFAL